MSLYFSYPNQHSRVNIIFELDLSNWETGDLKGVTGVDRSTLTSETDLGSFNSNLDAVKL